MKFNKFFMGVLGAMAFTACSSDEPINNPGNAPDGEYSDSYVTVSIEMPTSIGSRDGADDYNTPDNYDKGLESESAVDNIIFFFFDDFNNCIDIQIKDKNLNFSKPATPNNNPYVSSFGTVEVTLKAGLKYSQVAVALNSDQSDINTLKNQVKNLSQLEARDREYLKNIVTTGNNKGKGQVMSNSVYFNTASSNVDPNEGGKVILSKITEKNIYTSADRPNIDQLIAQGKYEYVKIYVERVAAKIDVKQSKTIMDNYSISSGEKVEKITLYNHNDLTSREVIVKPVLKGMILNVLTNSAKLIKPIDPTEVGYGIGGDGYKDFRWNDPLNYRSYWASTAFKSESAMTYFSWDDAEKKGNDAISQYVYPNTQDFEPITINEGNSHNTKIMVVAELCEFDETGKNLGALDFVRYGADYMLSGSLLTQAANQINVAVRNIDWDSESKVIKINDTPISGELLNAVKRVANNAFVTGFTGASLSLEMLNPNDLIENDKTTKLPGDADWEAKVINSSFTYNLEDISEDSAVNEVILTQVKAYIDETIAATLEDINTPRIFYWKDGKTYYYHNIRHQGFYGLVGDGDSNFLYGVVRNHIYDVTLNSIYGLGTPVIDPGRPIDPDRPQNERPSYIKAKINILPWRVVTNNATIH